jgi:hypothetical protein
MIKFGTFITGVIAAVLIGIGIILLSFNRRAAYYKVPAWMEITGVACLVLGIILFAIKKPDHPSGKKAKKKPKSKKSANDQ